MLVSFVLLVGGLIVYIGRRTAWALGCREWLPIVVYVLLMGAIMGLMAFSMSGRDDGPWAHAAVITANVGIGVLMMLVMSTAAVDLVRLLFRMSPTVFGVCVGLLTLVTTAYALINAATPRIKPVETELHGLNRTVRIVQLSDIHLGHFRGERHLQGIVDKVLSTDAEAVVITGDLFDSSYNYSGETLNPLLQLTRRMPVWFVDGNHDIYTDEQGIKQALRERGVRVLENECVELDDSGLQIVGLNYMEGEANSFMHSVPRPEMTIGKVLPKIAYDHTRPTLLLHHNPVGIKAAEAEGIDLYLAGHTHGGQLFPITLINDAMFGYNRGGYRVGQMQVYVSEGSGTFAMPMRLGTHSEITLHTLRPQAK